MISIPTSDITQLIISTAKEELLPRFARVIRQEKADGSIITEADLTAQRRLSDGLAKLSPEIRFLGEEMSVEEQREQISSGAALWCLDPLDGTSNFTAGIPYFSISLALIDQGRVVFGLVYDPVRDECFMAAEDEAPSLNGEPITHTEAPDALKKSIGLIDFKRLPAELATRLVVEAPYGSQRSFGSVALDWCWLAAGRSHLYLHGRQNIWDYAAGNYIFSQVGGQSCTLEGESVFTHALVPRSALGALSPELFKQWRDWLIKG